MKDPAAQASRRVAQEWQARDLLRLLGALGQSEGCGRHAGSLRGFLRGRAGEEPTTAGAGAAAAGAAAGEVWVVWQPAENPAKTSLPPGAKTT